MQDGVRGLPKFTKPYIILKQNEWKDKREHAKDIP